jgi:hypothetical protein
MLLNFFCGCAKYRFRILLDLVGKLKNQSGSVVLGVHQESGFRRVMWVFWVVSHDTLA